MYYSSAVSMPPPLCSGINIFSIVTTLTQTIHCCIIQRCFNNFKILVLRRPASKFLKNIKVATVILQFASNTHQRPPPAPQEAYKARPRCLQEASKMLPRRLIQNLNVLMAANVFSTLYFVIFYALLVVIFSAHTTRRNHKHTIGFTGFERLQHNN